MAQLGHRRKEAQTHVLSAHVSEKILQNGFVFRSYGAQRDRAVERRAGAFKMFGRHALIEVSGDAYMRWPVSPDPQGFNLDALTFFCEERCTRPHMTDNMVATASSKCGADVG
jgi:hypothetical protein